MGKNGSHPTGAALRDYAVGALAPLQSEVVEQHILQCRACAKVVAGAPHDGFVGRLRQAAHQRNPIDVADADRQGSHDQRMRTQNGATAAEVRTEWCEWTAPAIASPAIWLPLTTLFACLVYLLAS